MKKLLIILLALPIFSFAQDSTKNDHKFFKEMSLGIFTGPLGYISSVNKEIEVGYSLVIAPSLGLFSQKTFHYLQYDLVGNSIMFLNGYLLKNKWDTYVIYIQNLKLPDRYIGIGIEKDIPIIKKVNCLALSEIGTDLNGTYSFTLGALFYLENIFSLKK